MIATLSVLAWLAGCTCAPPAADLAVDPAPTAPPDALIDGTWPVAMAHRDDFLRFAQSPGWIGLIMQRQMVLTAPMFSGDPGGLARVHAELGALWRHAALLSAQSTVQTFGVSPDPADPAGMSHLLSVSYVLLGDLEAARKASLAVPADDPTAGWHAPWKTWLAGDAKWPPDLTTLPWTLPPPAPGTVPDLPPMPHLTLPERVDGEAKVREMGDIGAMVALALWHDSAARAAAPDLAPALDVWMAPHTWNAEPLPAAAPLPMDLQFGGDLPGPNDASFVADARRNGASAIDAWRDRSLLAWMVASSRDDAGKVDVGLVADRVAATREALVAHAAGRTGGEVESHHRQFADIAAVGSLRNLGVVLDSLGDHEGSGILRIAALEQSAKATAWPPGMIAQAAWDAGNRYPSRPAELLHAEIRRIPALEAVRPAIDALALRVGRERPGETPGM